MIPTGNCGIHWFQMQRMQHHVQLLMSFRESYLLQSCIKFELFPKASFGNSNDLNVNFALVLSGMVRESRIIFAAYMYLSSCFNAMYAQRSPIL